MLIAALIVAGAATAAAGAAAPKAPVGTEPAWSVQSAAGATCWYRVSRAPDEAAWLDAARSAWAARPVHAGVPTPQALAGATDALPGRGLSARGHDRFRVELVCESDGFTWPIAQEMLGQGHMQDFHEMFVDERCTRDVDAGSAEGLKAAATALSTDALAFPEGPARAAARSALQPLADPEGLPTALAGLVRKLDPGWTWHLQAVQLQLQMPLRGLARRAAGRDQVVVFLLGTHEGQQAVAFIPVAGAPRRAGIAFLRADLRVMHGVYRFEPTCTAKEDCGRVSLDWWLELPDRRLWPRAPDGADPAREWLQAQGPELTLKAIGLRQALEPGRETALKGACTR
jgi:hypothetical protein